MTKTIPNMIAARELALYAENDRDIYFQNIRPVIACLNKKAARQSFDIQKAYKAWESVAKAAAIKYNKEFGTPGTPYYFMFNASTRTAAAHLLHDSFCDEIKED